jgi:hypothetical protein
MKILIDPVYTGLPSTCSTSYLAWQIISDLIEWRDDIFFYILVPEQLRGDEDQERYWDQHKDRVTLINYAYRFRDRMQEMFKFNDQMQRIIWPAPGENKNWDFDAVLTSRLPQITNFRVTTGRMVSADHGSYQAVFAMDEMPIFKFRDTVSWTGRGELDLMSLNSYLSANGVIVNNLWTKDNVVKLAKKYLSPSKVAQLRGNVREAVPVKLQSLRVKQDKIKQPDETIVAFCGRITGTRNFVEASDLFRQHFMFTPGKSPAKFVLSTQSASKGAAKITDVDFIEVQENSREEFHEFLVNEAHVVVNLSTVEDFSLSTYEPLLNGVPVILPARDWADFVGPEYPFRAKDHVAAYALVKMFINDYPGMYMKFRDWAEDHWEKVVQSTANTTTSEVLIDMLTAHEKHLDERIHDGMGGRLREAAEWIRDNTEGDVDVVQVATEADYLVTRDDWTPTPIGRRTNLIALKLILQKMGFKDTNTPGVMTR